MTFNLCRWSAALLALIITVTCLAAGRGSDLVSPAPAQAAQILEIVGHIGGAPHDVVLRNGYAYVATGYALDVWDVREPTRPVLVVQTARASLLAPLNGNGDQPTRLRVDGQQLYLIDRNMVHIFDLSDPAAPKELGLYRFWLDISDMAPHGNVLYLSADAAGVGVATIDISDPASPQLQGYTADGYFDHLHIVSGALLASGDLSDSPGLVGLRTYDLSMPLAPQRVADTPSLQIRSADQAIEAPYLYAAWTDGVHIYDLSDGRSIRQVGLFPTMTPAVAVAVTGRRAFVVHGGSLEELDLTDPIHPLSRGQVAISMPYGDWDGGTSRVAAAGDLVMVIDRGGLTRVMSAVDGALPRELARLDSELPWSTDVSAGGGLAFVPSLQGNSLAVIDVTQPSAPTIIGAITLPDDGVERTTRSIALQGKRLYVLDNYGTTGHELRVIDVTSASEPRAEAVLDLGPGGADGLLVHGETAYVAGYRMPGGTLGRRLEVVRLLGGSSGPHLVGTIELVGETRGADGSPALALLGQHILLGIYKGAAIINVKDPTRPTTSGRFVAPDTIHTNAVVSSSGYGFLANYVNGSQQDWIHAFDIADPMAPQPAGAFESKWAPRVLGVSAVHLFMGSQAGVQMFAMDRPEQLRRLASVGLPPQEVRAISLHDGYAYVADGDAGLFILNTGDDDVPELVPPTPTPTAPAATPTTARGATPPPTPSGAVSGICPQILSRVPAAVLNAALANPDRVQGWNQLQNPNAPPSPVNRRRTWLSIQIVAVPFNVMFNPVLFRASCP